MADLEAILFDVDETLFDRPGAQLGVLDVILHEFAGLFAGIGKKEIIEAFLESDRITTEGLEYAVANVRLRRQQVFLQLLGLDEAHADALAALYVEQYPQMDAPIDGARVVVETLAARFPLGVVSNGLPDVQYRKLETLGIRHLFGCVVLSGELGIHKPDPAIFGHATERMGVTPERCLYVGDSYASDVVGARRAGMLVCWFNPDEKPPAGEVVPDFEILALEEILEVVL